MTPLFCLVCVHVGCQAHPTLFMDFINVRYCFRFVWVQLPCAFASSGYVSLTKFLLVSHCLGYQRKLQFVFHTNGPKQLL